jgi:transcriptional regulator of aromatic amino acid metabolism
VLEILLQYGYNSEQVTVGRILKQDGGVSLRVARQKRAAIIPDVSQDRDYYQTTPETHSLLSVPILREERVVAVMTLESHKLNGFGEEHLAFARKLASRAGVTVHNARLFSETQRERHKLAMILRHIADLVVVIDESQRVLLLNHAALQVFGLSEQKSYVGEPLASLIPDSPLIDWLNALDPRLPIKDPSLRLPNGRIYNVSVNEHPDIGQMVVLQDVTHFKEMDRLKSELVATVTHDLKQPLSIMRGYLDLLTMSGSLDDRAKRYVNSLLI